MPRKKTPGGTGGGAGTHTGHTGAHGHTDHTDEPHNHPNPPWSVDTPARPRPRPARDDRIRGRLKHSTAAAPVTAPEPNSPRGRLRRGRPQRTRPGRLPLPERLPAPAALLEGLEGAVGGNESARSRRVGTLASSQVKSSRASGRGVGFFPIQERVDFNTRYHDTS